MLAALCVSLTVITMNVSLLNVGLPTLARQLGATNSDLEWIVDGYSLVFAGFLMAAGALGDRCGGRPVILAGLGVFGLGSLYSAMASSSVELIVGRSVTGLGGALVTPMTLSVMREVFPKEVDLRRAIGIWASTASAGAVVAPLAAGLLLGAFWWGSLFLANVPLDVVMIVAVWLTVPDPMGRASLRFDWAGAGLSVVLSCSAVFALIEGPSFGWSHPVVAGSLGVIVLSGAGFWFWERRSPAPLVDLSCFAQRRFSVGSGVVAMQYFFSFGTGFLVTQYLQLVVGLSALRTGVAFVPSAAVLMLVAPWGARAFGRYGARVVTTLALTLAGAGTALLGLLTAHSPVVLTVAALVATSTAIGLMAAGTTSMVMSAVRPDQAGMASGVQNTTRQLGGAIGVAVCGSAAASRYASDLTSRIHGTGAAHLLPTARRSLASALTATGRSDAGYGLLVSASRQAFLSGLHLAVWITTGVALGSAVAVWVALRPTRAEVPAPLPAAGATQIS